MKPRSLALALISALALALPSASAQEPAAPVHKTLGPADIIMPHITDSKHIELPCVKGIAERTIAFEADPDFGYEVASGVPGFDDPELLQPRRLYERQDRADTYAEIVDTLKTDRVAHLQQFTQLSEEIIKAVG